MLTITPSAAEALQTVVSASEEAPEGTGLRISQAVGQDGQPALGLTLAPQPEPDDHVVDDAAVPVFLAPETVDLLSDKVLDARVQDEQITFQLAEQSA